MPMKQQTLSMAADQTFENYRKPTRRDEFLKAMEAIVPWSALCKSCTGGKSMSIWARLS